MGPSQVFFLVELRPALKNAFPAMINQYVMLFLCSSVASIIALPELTYVPMISKNRAVRGLCKAYVNVIRGIPLLVILFMAFYGVPLLTRVDVSQSMASIGSLTVYSGAYIAEIVRGSIQSIPKGQTEAANALGMSTLQRVRLVVLPQAFRVMLPPDLLPAF